MFRRVDSTDSDSTNLFLRASRHETLHKCLSRHFKTRQILNVDDNGPKEETELRLCVRLHACTHLHATASSSCRTPEAQRVSKVDCSLALTLTITRSSDTPPHQRYNLPRCMLGEPHCLLTSCICPAQQCLVSSQLATDPNQQPVNNRNPEFPDISVKCRFNPNL